MFGFLRPDPRKRLTRQYAALSEEAMRFQRAGKMKEFAEKTAEAEAVRAQLDALDAAGQGG